MNHDDNPYYVAYLREKQARTEVEQLLEASTRQLYEKNLLLQQQISQIQQQQQSMIQQEKMALLGTLAAGIAHEINNPLAFILSNVETFGNYSQLLLKTMQDQHHQTTEHIMLVAEDLPELISETSEGLARIEAIVKNLLFFARADSDSPTDIQLAEALEFTLQLLQPMLHHTELHRNFLPVASVRFQLNELNQVLLNIIVNAVQACEAVPERANQIQLHLSQTAQHVICKICDNGCGMSPDILNRMFDAFFTTKEVGCGTGVGMAIVLRALQQHQCNIEVHSEPGQGTEVAIFFPRSQQESAP